MAKLTQVAHFLLVGSVGAACALSCGAGDDKKEVPRHDAQAGEAPLAGVGGQSEAAEPSGGAGGEPPASESGGGGAPAGEGGEGGSEMAHPCVAELPCDTNPGAPCTLGVTECSREGGSSCVDDAPEMDGLTCPGGSCHGGACIAPFRLFNTGVDGQGAVLEGGSIDPHYTLLESAESTLPGPDAVVATQIADGYWLAQSDTSKWIAPSPNQAFPGASPCNASGTYVYRTSFDLTGYDPTTLTISGGWAADNSGADIRLNGVGLGLPAGSYAPLTTFTIDEEFLPGVNTLDFVVTDVGCPNGLRVELAASDVQLD